MQNAQLSKIRLFRFASILRISVRKPETLFPAPKLIKASPAPSLPLPIYTYYLLPPHNLLPPMPTVCSKLGLPFHQYKQVDVEGGEYSTISKTGRFGCGGNVGSLKGEGAGAGTGGIWVVREGRRKGEGQGTF